MYRGIVLVLALTVIAFSQSPTLKLTPRDAIALALKQHPQVILATLNTAQAEEERALARSALLPQVSGRVQETVSRVNLEASIGFRFPTFAQHVGLTGRRRPAPVSPRRSSI